MIKVLRRTTVPVSLRTGHFSPTSRVYKSEDVIQALRDDFSKKCYICEILPARGLEVEHLRPHDGGDRLELKYDWNNLFPACKHCNNVKNNIKYRDMILDCCVEDPENFIAQRFIDGSVRVQCLCTENLVAVMTAELVQECFNTFTTGIRTAESQDRVDELSRDMGILLKTLEQYKSELKLKSCVSNRRIGSLRSQLSRKSQFAGFKRQYIRDHVKDYPELAILLE